MKKPANFTIENNEIFNIRRSTAEALAVDGLLVVTDDDKLSTRHRLTAKGLAFFNTPKGKHFKWEGEQALAIEHEEEAEAETGGEFAGLKTTADWANASRNPAHPHYRPYGTYQDETDPVMLAQDQEKLRKHKGKNEAKL